MTEVRRRWRATLVLALMVGLAGGTVLAAVAGARRTETAFERFRVESLAADARVQIGEDGYLGGLGPGGEEAVRQLRALPEVASVAVIELFIGSNPESAYDVAVIAGEDPVLETLGRPRIVAGRLPDRDEVGEVATNEATAAEAGLEVGDRFTISTFTPEQLMVIEKEFTGLDGPELELELVGIVRMTDDLIEAGGPAGGFYGTRAFHDLHLGEVGSYGGVMEVRLEEGVDPLGGVERVREVVGGVDDLDEVNVEAAADRTSQVLAATDVLADGLLAFAAAATLAAVVALGQALSRRLATLADDQATLDALGCTRGQRAAGALLTVVPVAVGGAVAAALVAALASPLLPIGVARLAEPDPGFDVDVALLGLGALGVAVAVVAMASISAVRVSALHRRDGAASRTTGRLRRSGAVAASARVGAPAPAVLGVAMALEPGRGRTAVPVRPALAGAVIGTAGIVAALTFGASLDRLVETPSAYGWTFDLAPETYEDGNDVLVDSDDAADVGVVDLAIVEVGGRAMQGMSVTALKGAPQLAVVDGRAPASPGEVALGGRDLEALDVALGGRVAIVGADGEQRDLTVVGEAIFPILDGNAFDRGALLHPDTLSQAARSGGFDQAIVAWAPGVEHPAAEARLLDRLPDALPVYAYPSRPGSVANLGGVATLPRVLAGFLVVVALAAIGHALIAGVVRRRRDLAVVRVLGFARCQVATTVTWQSVTLVVIGLAVGIPIGLAAGRLVWTAVAEGIGVPASPVVPVPVVAALVPLILLAGIAFAALPARSAVRHRPVDGLRVE